MTDMNKNATASSQNNATVPTPQEDFYLHVNKRWLDNPDNAIPGDYSRWGGFLKLHDQSLIDQIELVKELSDKPLNDLNVEQKKIVAIWRAAQDRFSKWRQDRENKEKDIPERVSNYDCILKELEVFDNMLGFRQASFDDLNEAEKDYEHAIKLATYLHYTQMSGISNVFDFDKGQDLVNSNNVVLDFSVHACSLPSREYYTEEKFAEKRELYKKHLTNVYNIINADNPILDESFVEDVLAFENKAAYFTMKREQSREYVKYYENTTLAGVHQNVNSLNSLPAKGRKLS